MILEYHKNCLEVESTFQKLNPLRVSHVSISFKVWYLPEKRFPEEEFFYSSEVAKLTRTNAKELSLKMKERQICRKKMECKSHLQIASWTWQGQRKGKESSRRRNKWVQVSFLMEGNFSSRRGKFNPESVEGITWVSPATFSQDKEQCLTVIWNSSS